MGNTPLGIRSRDKPEAPASRGQRPLATPILEIPALASQRLRVYPQVSKQVIRELDAVVVPQFRERNITQSVARPLLTGFLASERRQSLAHGREPWVSPRSAQEAPEGAAERSGDIDQERLYRPFRALLALRFGVPWLTPGARIFRPPGAFRAR